jgi:cyanophycinase
MKNSPFGLFITLLVSKIVIAQGSLLLVGGGGENYNSWSDIPYSWFVQQADSGIIINIDVDEVADWYPGYFKSFGAAEGTQALRIASKSVANDSATYRLLTSASGIFMEGGDQWDYVSVWKGTLVEDAIHYVFQNGGAIGGTSAGLAVLGDVVFDAKNGSAYPDQTAYNPYHSRISMTDDFLNILPNVLTDSHFHSRGRIGRLVPMLARRIQDSGQENITGIGVADKTAMCIDPDMTARVYGRASVTVLYKSENSYINCQSGVPLTFTNIKFDQLIHGAVYDLKNKKLIEPGSYLTELDPLDFPTRQYADTILDGSLEQTNSLGDMEVLKLTDNNLNAWYGNLQFVAGDSVIPYTTVVSKIWNDSDFYENRIMGGMHTLYKNPHQAVIYLDDGCQTEVTNQGVLTAGKLTYILEGYGMTHSGVTGQYKTNYCGIIGAELHFLATGDKYDLRAHNTVLSIPIKKDKNQPRKTHLYHNYPNPFNPFTIISYELPVAMNVRLEIFDLLGRRISVLTDGFKSSGRHQVAWNADGLGSGVYLYRLNTADFTQTKSCILLR